MRSQNKRNSDSSQRREGAGKRFSSSRNSGSSPRGEQSRNSNRDDKPKFAPRNTNSGDSKRGDSRKPGFERKSDRSFSKSNNDRNARSGAPEGRFNASFDKHDDGKRSNKPAPYAPRPRAEFDKARGEERAASTGFGDRNSRSSGFDKPRRNDAKSSNFSDRKPRSRDGDNRDRPTFGKSDYSKTEGPAPRKDFGTGEGGKRKPFERPFGYRQKPTFKKDKFATKEVKEGMRLNKYLAQAGICSRREADELIKTGLVLVNDEIVVQMGYQVMPTDTVKYNGQTLRGERTKYLLLNKPKGFITTTDDPRARKTVMDLVGKACKERIYPVGRLDRATTGVLLFTNDGDMAKKLTHPSHGAKKIYHVQLDKKLADKDLVAIKAGFELEDGPVVVDKINNIEGKDKSHIGIELHIGRNRIVRRIFSHFGYEVIKLDRVAFGGLTKKNLPRGTWRFLSPKEVGFLKML